MAVKLKLPPGFYSNGTEYSGAGRWIDGDLVRWHNNVIKPINGWQMKFDFGTSAPIAPVHDTTEAVRSGVVVTNSVNGVNLYLGSNAAIYRVSASNVVTDVTPVGFVAQSKHAVSSRGYGSFRYSFGQYGTPRPDLNPTISIVFSWGFSEWGYWPIAVARGLTSMPLQIKKDTDATFIDIAGSPTGAFDVLVTDERFVMTFGKTDDYRLIQWSDREDYTEWTPDPTNQAGSQVIAGTGKLLRGVKVINQILILGENDAFSGRYVGPPYVYGFDRIGEHCGAIGPQAVAVTAGFAMWLSDLSFWKFDGTISEVPCEVMDYYQSDHNKLQRSKTHAFTVSDYSEIWWLYQSNSAETMEPDSYIIYNWSIEKWYYGRLDRTFGLDSDPLIYPFMISSSGTMYDHEVVSAGRDDRVPFITSGPLEVNNGTKLMGLAWVLPDDKTRGDIAMTLAVRDNAQDVLPRYSMDYILTNPTSTTGIAGRDIRMTLKGTLTNPNWMVGDFRVEPVKSSLPGR